jgi:hypothetical protein
MKKYSMLPALLLSLFLAICSISKAQPNYDMRSYINPDKKVYLQGEKIRVNFSGFPGFQKDWIGIYKFAATHRNFLTWKYTAGYTNGVMEFDVPKDPGNYELRGFANDGYEMFATSMIITVRPAGVTIHNTNWAGTWNVNYFTNISIEQSGNTITGKYAKGKIRGIANGNIITGWWYEGTQEGRFEFVMSADGRTFEGKRGYNDDIPTIVCNATIIIRPGIVVITEPARPFTVKDLEGTWDATGYTCETSIALEKIKITVTGNKITAVKITGDNCVPAGEITWEGTLSGNIISGRGRVSSGAGTARRWLDGVTINVVDRDTLKGFLGVTYRRN